MCLDSNVESYIKTEVNPLDQFTNKDEITPSSALYTNENSRTNPQEQGSSQFTALNLFSQQLEV